MNAKEFFIKVDALPDEDVERIADCFIIKLKQQFPALALLSENRAEEPIKMPEVCRLLEISDTTARSWMTKGTLPFHRKGKRVYFFKSEVLKSLEQPLKRS